MALTEEEIARLKGAKHHKTTDGFVESRTWA